MRKSILIAAMFTLSVSQAESAEWLTNRSYYTHSPETGDRVTQYSPIGPFYVQTDPTYVRSGYRNNRSSIQVGGSADHLHIVEQWGLPVRPYGEWQYPYRPYSVPYGMWGSPYAGLGGYGYGLPLGGYGAGYGGYGPGYGGLGQGVIPPGGYGGGFAPVAPGGLLPPVGEEYLQDPNPRPDLSNPFFPPLLQHPSHGHPSHGHPMPKPDPGSSSGST